jgi:hypothetical protein
MYRRLAFAVTATLVFCLMSPIASADIIWGTVSHTAPTNQSGELAVLLTAGTTGTFMGGTTYQLQGMTSTGTLVNISTNNAGSSGTDQLFANTSVQLLANPLNSSDTSIDQLTFSITGNTFNDMFMNLFGAFTGSDTVSFVVTTNDGTFTHIFTGLTDDNTNNWIFLTTTAGETITSVSLSDTRFYSLQNLTVSGVGPLPTPEPASLLLIGTGSAFWLASFKRKGRRRS